MKIVIDKFTLSHGFRKLEYVYKTYIEYLYNENF